MISKNEKRFLELTNEVSLANNYEHLHVNLMFHKCG